MPEFAALFNAVPDALIAVTCDGTVVQANEQAQRLFGYRPDELTGQSVDILLPERVRAAHREDRATYMAEPRSRPMGVGLDLVALRNDGSEFPVEISLSPLYDGDELLVLAVIHDLTQRRRVESDRAALLAEAQLARAQLEGVLTITDVALSHLDLNELLVELLDRVHTVLSVDATVLLRHDAERGELSPWQARGLLSDEVMSQVRIPVGRGFAGKVAAERRPIIVPDVDDIEVYNSLLKERGIRSLLGTPLITRGHLVAVLHVGTVTPRHFTDADAEMLVRVADRIALAIDNALLYQ